MLNTDGSNSTSTSLLQRVRRMDAEAWDRFCALYTPIVYGWCRGGGLQDSDAADAVQEVFRAVFQGIRQFQRDRQGTSFRGWLAAITRNQVRLHYRRQARLPQAVGGSDAREQFARHADAAAASDPPLEIDAEDVTTRCRIVQRALDLVRGDFSPGVWQAFVSMQLQGRPAQDVAAELGTTENAVRQAKFRVLRRLREELHGQL